MTLYYTRTLLLTLTKQSNGITNQQKVCFGLLMSEISLFVAIICPMPFTLRKKMFHFLSENPVVAKIQYGLKITFIFVAVLFVDAVQRMFRVAQEGETAKAEKGLQDVRVETNYTARKFYAQRNLYLTGATLFLSLLLSRVFYIILDFINVQEAHTALKAKVAASSGDNGQAEARVLELEAQLKELGGKERDLETLKKQAGSQAREYDRLADEHNLATGAQSNKKAD